MAKKKAAAGAKSEPAPPAQLGPWRLVRKLGSGAFSSVYEAEFTGNDDKQRDIIGEHEWVLKASPVPPAARKKKKGDQTPGATLLSKEYTVYRILHEQAVATSGAAKDATFLPIPKTPKVVQWKYQYEEGGWCFLALERLGQSLSEAMGACEGPVPAETALNATAQLLRALEFVHAKEFVFRDVKPDNFMLGRKDADRNTLFVVDFGAACKEFSHKKTREPADPVGTPMYMSMRIHRGEPPCPRDDLESLAYLLVQMAAGALPWADAPSEEAVLELKTDTPSDELCAPISTANLRETCKAFLDAILELGEDCAVPYDDLFAILTSPLGKKASSVSDLRARELVWAPKPAPAKRTKTAKGSKTEGSTSTAAAKRKSKTSTTAAAAKARRAGPKSRQQGKKKDSSAENVELDLSLSSDDDDDENVSGDGSNAEDDDGRSAGDDEVVDLTRRMTRSMVKDKTGAREKSSKDDGRAATTKRRKPASTAAKRAKSRSADPGSAKAENMAQAAIARATQSSKLADAAKSAAYLAGVGVASFIVSGMIHYNPQ